MRREGRCRVKNPTNSLLSPSETEDVLNPEPQSCTLIIVPVHSGLTVESTTGVGDCSQSQRYRELRIRGFPLYNYVFPLVLRHKREGGGYSTCFQPVSMTLEVYHLPTIITTRLTAVSLIDS